MRARLVIVRGQGSPHSLELDPAEPASHGRSRDSDIVLHDLHASLHHAQVLCQDGRWFIRDRDTRNGTRVNGVRVQGEVELPDGCEIAIADMRLRFVVFTHHEATPGDTAEAPRAAILAERVRREVDEAAGLLLMTVARGDTSALPPLADRLEEIGRPELAEGFRAIALNVASTTLLADDLAI